jgi:hypothetical protein
MHFEDMMREYWRLRTRYETGTLSGDEFEAGARALQVTDAAGQLWQIGVRSGRWYRHDGEAWVEDAPPFDGPTHESVMAAEPAPSPTLAPGTVGMPQGKRRPPWLTFGLVGLGIVVFGCLGLLGVAAATGGLEWNIAFGGEATSTTPSVAPASRTAEPEPTPTQGRMAYDTTFYYVRYFEFEEADDTRDPDYWGKIDTSDYRLTFEKREEKGLARLQLKGPISTSMISDIDSSGVMLEAIVEMDDVDSALGLFCRYQDDDNYLGLLVAGDGYWSIFERTAGENKPLANGSKPELIRPGTMVSYRFTCDRDLLSAVADENGLGTAVTTEMRSGRAGFLAASQSEKGGSVEVDMYALAIAFEDVKNPDEEIAFQAGEAMAFHDMTVTLEKITVYETSAIGAELTVRNESPVPRAGIQWLKNMTLNYISPIENIPPNDQLRKAIIAPGDEWRGEILFYSDSQIPTEYSLRLDAFSYGFPKVVVSVSGNDAVAATAAEIEGWLSGSYEENRNLARSYSFLPGDQPWQEGEFDLYSLQYETVGGQPAMTVLLQGQSAVKLVSDDVALQETSVSVTGGYPSEAEGLGLLCRANASGEDGYLALVSQVGHWEIGKLSGGGYAVLAEGEDPAIKPRSAAGYTFECRWDMLSLMIDDRYVGSANDSEFTTGAVGLAMVTSSSGGAGLVITRYEVRAFVTPPYYGPYTAAELPVVIGDFQIELQPAVGDRGTSLSLSLVNLGEAPWTVNPGQDMRLETIDGVARPDNALQGSSAGAMPVSTIGPGERLTGAVHFDGLDLTAGGEFIFSLAAYGLGDVRIVIPPG